MGFSLGCLMCYPFTRDFPVWLCSNIENQNRQPGLFHSSLVEQENGKCCFGKKVCEVL